ncbi:MAG: exosortase F system-associated protein [Polaribacter sp.]|nr:exosortase F system-associated protein [Polaribacter sp.]
MRKSVKIVLFLFLLLLLILIRAFETELFYDPLIDYFRNDFLHKKIDDMDRWRLIIHMLYRYVLNTTISLGLIWVLFKRTDYVKFSVIFFFLAILILIFVFIILLQDDFQGGYLLLFYVRRFIIHPIFVLLLLTVFYYQKLIPS